MIGLSFGAAEKSAIVAVYHCCEGDNPPQTPSWPYKSKWQTQRQIESEEALIISPNHSILHLSDISRAPDSSRAIEPACKQPLGYGRRLGMPHGCLAPRRVPGVLEIKQGLDNVRLRPLQLLVTQPHAQDVPLLSWGIHKGTASMHDG